MDYMSMGLSDVDVLMSRKENGENIVTPTKKTPWWKLYLEKFNDPIIRILIIAAVISIIVGFVEGSFFEGIGIIIAIFLATGLSFFNEFKAGKEFDILNKVSDENPVKTVRNGKYTSIPKRDVVVGDIVILETGEEVPADGEILESVLVEVDESKLTGESVAAKKSVRGTGEESKENAYPYYFLLSGTNIVSGHCVMKVKAVGDKADVAQTIRASIEDVEGKTPLTRQLEGLSKIIGVGGFSFAFLTFISMMIMGIVNGHFDLSLSQWLFTGIMFISTGVLIKPVWNPIIHDLIEIITKVEYKGKEDNWLKSISFGVITFAVFLGAGILSGYISKNQADWITLSVAKEILEYFMIAVTIIVVAVPEGLPMSVTLSLAYSMRKMTASNNLVRKMHACETIGAATVICTDKTGTLTMNKMTVFEDKLTIKNDDFIKKLISVNSTAHLEEKNGEIEVMGNPTEGALLLWINSQGDDYDMIRKNTKIISQMPFSSEKKMMATLIKDDNDYFLLVKGATEVILENSTMYMEKTLLNIQEKKQLFHDEIIGYQHRGMRTLGFAYRKIENLHTSIEDELHDLLWCGFIVISDPVRPDVPDAIKMCRDAGIDVKVITGDNHLMATEIGRQIGSIDKTNENKKGTVLTGPEFNAMNDDEVRGILSNLKILSRAKPLDKLRTVKLLKERGEVVAVTGDGTNDAPALNYADVGLAMGKTGTSVAKEASDIILLDDSFTSIVNAVMWGRSLYKNIQRFIVFQLTINVVAVVIAFIGPFMGISLPFTVTQMLWINLIMDTFAALALATEPPQVSVMKEKPRKSNDFIITRDMAVQIFTFATLFFVVMLIMMFYIKSISKDLVSFKYMQSLFFNIFVFMQVWNLFNARVFGSGTFVFKGFLKNKAFITIIFMITIMQFMVIQFGGDIMRTVPLSFRDWVITIGATFAVVIAGELMRVLKKSK